MFHNRTCFWGWGHRNHLTQISCLQSVLAEGRQQIQTHQSSHSCTFRVRDSDYFLAASAAKNCKKKPWSSRPLARPPQGGCASSRLNHGLNFYVMRGGCASSRLIHGFSDSAVTAVLSCAKHDDRCLQKMSSCRYAEQSKKTTQRRWFGCDLNLRSIDRWLRKKGTFWSHTFLMHGERISVAVLRVFFVKILKQLNQTF